MRRNRAIFWPVTILMIVGFSVPLIAAAVLQKKTLQSWNTYVQWTEKRIASELQGNSGYLRMDHMKPAAAADLKSQLKAGNVYIERLTTFDGAGHEIHGDDGLIHHWYGVIFIPGVKLEPLLRWIQDYDQQSRYFKEVEQSKLLSRNGDTFRIALRLVRKKVVT